MHHRIRGAHRLLAHPQLVARNTAGTSDPHPQIPLTALPAANTARRPLATLLGHYAMEQEPESWAAAVLANAVDMSHLGTDYALNLASVQYPGLSDTAVWRLVHALLRLCRHSPTLSAPDALEACRVALVADAARGEIRARAEKAHARAGGTPMQVRVWRSKEAQATRRRHDTEVLVRHLQTMFLRLPWRP